MMAPQMQHGMRDAVKPDALAMMDDCTVSTPPMTMILSANRPAPTQSMTVTVRRQEDGGKVGGGCSAIYAAIRNSSSIFFMCRLRRSAAAVGGRRRDRPTTADEVHNSTCQCQGESKCR